MISMLQRTKSARTVLASMLAVMVAVSFYPAAAFADTDYEAAYNQAKSNTQAAYDAWQTAVNDANNLLPAVDEAEATKTAAENAVEPAKQEMDKAHRLLDYKTRQAMDTLAQQAWSKDYGTTISNANWYYNTDARMQAILYDAYGKVSWHGGARVEIEKFKANSESSHKRINACVPYGITTSASGTDDTNSLNLYQKYVYLNESYENLMLTLDYFNEHNAIRNYYKTDAEFDGPTTILVSPYLLIQSATNAPVNKYSHSIRSMSGAKQCSQNMTSTWGEVNTPPKHTIDDPFDGLFYSERPSAGGHYQNILAKHTHAGMICSWNTSGKTFEQDFANTPNATGYTVEDYRAAINNYVASELTAYNNAINAYDQANANVTSTADAYDAAYAAWWQADRNAQKKEQAYKDAEAAEQSAYDAWQNWLKNQNQGGTTNPGTDPGTTPDPTEPSVETPSKVTGLTLTETTHSNQPAIKVSWNSAANAVRYKVYQRKANGTWGFRTATSTSTTLTYLLKGTTYEVKVAGISSDGTEGPVSDVKSLTTAASSSGDTGSNPTTEQVEVGKVTGVSLKETNITGTGSHIVITWNKASGASKYIVRYAVDGDGFSPAGTYITTTSYTFTYGKPGKTYSFKVIPYGSDGTEGTASDIVKITTTTDVPTAPSNTGEDTNPNATVTPTQPTKPTAPSAQVYVKSYVKSFKVVKGKKSFTAKWKKQSKANQKKFNGYQIRYSTKKNMKGAKYVTVKKSAKSKKIKKLKAKKKYYVQARTYTVTRGKKVYSKWTKIKAVKTK